MKFEIDTQAALLVVVEGEERRELPLWEREAFEVVSHLWLKQSWNQKYSYTFSWFGRPIIQHPEDLVRLQEVIFNLRPDFIVETGIAHGGSLIFYASLLRAIGKGRVIGVDIEIRPHNRDALERHELIDLVDLIEGDSVSHAVVADVRERIEGAKTVLVILDSDHSHEHVLRELEAYHTLVTPRSWIVATDGVMMWVHDVPRGRPEWRRRNPVTAVQQFLKTHPDFSLEMPRWQFNESELNKPITAWPSAWLRRRAV